MLQRSLLLVGELKAKSLHGFGVLPFLSGEGLWETFAFSQIEPISVEVPQPPKIRLLLIFTHTLSLPPRLRGMQGQPVLGLQGETD